MPITKIISEDNPEQADKSEDNLNHQAKRPPPKPPNVKSDFKPLIHRNLIWIRIRNPYESTK